MDSLIKTGVERRNRSASPVENGADEDESRGNDTHIGDAICVTEEVGDPTEHDHAGVHRNQIYCHPDNEFQEGTKAAAWKLLLASRSRRPADQPVSL